MFSSMLFWVKEDEQDLPAFNYFKDYFSFVLVSVRK